MKNVILLFILFCLFFSCKSNNEINLKIQEAEELIRAEQPDSAFALLESITNPYICVINKIIKIPTSSKYNNNDIHL